MKKLKLILLPLFLCLATSMNALDEYDVFIERLGVQKQFENFVNEFIDQLKEMRTGVSSSEWNSIKNRIVYYHVERSLYQIFKENYTIAEINNIYAQNNMTSIINGTGKLVHTPKQKVTDKLYDLGKNFSEIFKEQINTYTGKQIIDNRRKPVSREDYDVPYNAYREGYTNVKGGRGKYYSVKNSELIILYREQLRREVSRLKKRNHQVGPRAKYILDDSRRFSYFQKIIRLYDKLYFVMKYNYYDNLSIEENKNRTRQFGYERSDIVNSLADTNYGHKVYNLLIRSLEKDFYVLSSEVEELSRPFTLEELNQK